MVDLKAPRRTRRQRILQEQVEGQSLSEAVPFAIRTLFRFTHRASDAKALWSDAHVVWLGKSTFMNWCMEDPDFDVAWIVSKARNLPKEREAFHEMVRAEIMSFFTSQLSVLPRKKTGNWLPLP